MTNYISSDFNFTSVVASFREELTTSSITIAPLPGAFDIIIPPSEIYHYDMRGTDTDCGIGNSTYRYWTTVGSPDSTGAYYFGTKCGATPLSNIVIVRKYILII